MIEPRAEGREILMQLAVDHERPIGSEQMRHGRDGEFAGLIRVAEKEFAGCKRSPGFPVVEKLSLPRLRVAFDAKVLRIAETVSKAKVLARRGLAADDLRCGILGIRAGLRHRCRSELTEPRPGKRRVPRWTGR